MLRSAALFGYPELGELAALVEEGANSASDDVAEYLKRMETLSTRMLAGLPLVNITPDELSSKQ